MKYAVVVALALTAVPTVGAGQSQQNEAAVSMSVVRSYRAATSQTVVDLFCRIPLLLVTPQGTTGSGGGAFRFAIAVRDSAGLELVSQSWLTPVRGELLRTRGASTAEHMTFAARPGRYAVSVTVTDSASGRVARAAATVDAFHRAPAGSDLLLASDMRADAADTAARAGELRRGSLFLVTTGEPVLTPQASKLAYYLELYPAQAESVMVAARVLTESGTQLVATAPTPVAIGTGGGFTNGVVDLAGLPPGRYRFEVTATGPDSQVVRSAMFGMTGFETVVQAAAVAAAGEWPASLTEPELDEAYQPLIYLMSAEEQGVYSSLSLEGKRKWLRQFWARRDPTAGTRRNEERERFYAAIEEANRRYREGGASAIPGWRTDRGRVFIKYGAPDEVLERRVQTGASPYEIWKYTRNRSLKYVFMDLTRFGNYTLIFTNDVRERSRPDWQEMLGPDGLADLEL